MVFSYPPGGAVHADTSIDTDQRPGFECSEVEASLESALREAPQRIPLTVPPSWVEDSEFGDGACAAVGSTAWKEFYDRPVFEDGKLGTSSAKARSIGPSGSGLYWEVTIWVRQPSGTMGVCFETETTGMRNIHGPYFPRWKLFQDRTLVVWHAVDMRGGLYYSLLYPAVYRLEGNILLFDRAATLRQVRKFGLAYAKTAADKRDSEPALHSAAAAAYLAVADGRHCPVRSGTAKP